MSTNSTTGPLSKVIQKAKDRAITLYGNKESNASKQTAIDYAVGYMGCKKDLNAMLNDKGFEEKLRGLIAGQVVHKDTVRVILNAVLNEITLT
jgi:hypothetical protein